MSSSIRTSQPRVDLRLHPRQGRAYLSRATEILYGGAAGGGKSHLFRVAAISWCLQIPGLQVYLFRREFPDLWKNHMTGAGSFPELLAPLVNCGAAKINTNDKVIRFPQVRSAIHLCHCQYEKDVYGYQGAEIHVLIIDELTQWLEPMYRYLRGRVRLGGLEIPDRLKGAFPRVLNGANPGGIGHNWVKKGFIDIAPAGELTQMPKDEGGMLRQFIPALLEDNPTLLENDPDYEDRLEGLGSVALVKAMRRGDWNIVAGGAFDDVWTDRVVVPRFKVPSSWAVDRSHDWGSAKPFANLWFAEADGTEATLPDGRKFCPPRGSLVVAHEWYGSNGRPNEGLKMGARQVAKGIKEREAELVKAGWFASTPRPGPADNSIRDVADPAMPSIEKEMAAEGVRWHESDKSPGSRKNGLELIRSRLKEAGKGRPEAPALYVMEHCRGLISRLPTLPRDAKNPDDVDSKAEDHDYDALRYRVLKQTRATTTTPLRM